MEIERWRQQQWRQQPNTTIHERPLGCCVIGSWRWLCRLVAVQTTEPARLRGVGELERTQDAVLDERKGLSGGVEMRRCDEFCVVEHDV